MAADKGSGAGGSASAEIGKYLDILAKDPSSRVFAPLAEAYRKAGLLDDAIETAREGLSVHPNYLGGRVALGRALFEKKSYAEAAEELRKVVKASPDNIIAHKVLGQVALAQGSLPDAEKSFRMVTLLDPHDQEAKKLLADIGAGGPPPAAPAAVKAAAAESWGEVALQPGSPLEDLESHRPPVDAAPVPPPPEPYPMEEIAVGPSAIELEEPDEVPETLPDIDIPAVDFEADAPSPPGGLPQPQAAELLELPATELQSPTATEPLALELEVPPQIELPPIELPEPSAATEPEDTAEIEIFGREPAGLSMSGAAVGVPAAEAPAEEESPFEVFGRPKRGGPSSAKGEREAYAEIEIEPTGHAAAGEPDADQDSVFEMFTREPRVVGGAVSRPGHAERSTFEQIDVEPTAYVPPEPQEGEPPVIELREEIPRIDVQSELELALELERAPVDAAVVETAAEEIGWEDEASSPAEQAAAAEETAPLLAPEEAATEELVWEPAPEPPIPHGEEVPEPSSGTSTPAAVSEEIFTLEEEIPSVDLAGEVLPEESAGEPTIEAPGESAAEGEDAFADFDTVGAEPAPEAAPAVELEPAASAEPVESTETATPVAGRGVFDTETLASIYINQGFYGRAAAIYERLSGANPGDVGLRRKLEEVRGLESAQAGAAAAAAPDTTPAGRDRAETIRRLEALLAAFRGVRPR